MIAVDAPVLVELLANGPRADAAEACLRQALGSGRVVVCDAALAGVCASLKNGAEALAALEEMGVHYNAIESKSALRAGEMLRRQRQRNGQPRPLADFLVGAHALLQCDALITFENEAAQTSDRVRRVSNPLVVLQQALSVHRASASARIAFNWSRNAATSFSAASRSASSVSGSP